MLKKVTEKWRLNMPLRKLIFFFGWLSLLLIGQSSLDDLFPFEGSAADESVPT
jgi:hypothetical protein